MSAATPRATFYAPSGLVPMAAWVLLPTALVPLAALFGIAYCVVIVLIPFLKLRWLGSLALGWVLGLTVAKFCHLTKVRSRSFATLSAVVALLVAWYSAWGIHRTVIVVAQLGPDVGLAQLVVLGFIPSEIISWMKLMFDQGGTAQLKSWPLVGVWLIELATIAYFTITTFKAQQNDQPFCEHCDRWNGTADPFIELPVSAGDPAWQQVSEGWLDGVRKLKIKEQDGEQVTLLLSTCPECDRSNYLSASGGGWQPDGNGGVVFMEIPIIRHMAITPKQIEELRELGELLDEAYEELQGTTEVDENQADGTADWPESADAPASEQATDGSNAAYPDAEATPPKNPFSGER